MLDILAAQLVVLRAQVGGLQAQIDVLQALVDEQRSVATAAAAAECPHLDTEDEGSTLGQSRRRCLDPRCRQLLVEEAVHE